MAMSHPDDLSDDESTITPDPFTSPIHVVSMNVSGPGDGPGTALRTRKLIADVVISEEPDLVLFQEFKWKGVKGRGWYDTPLPGHYVYTGNTEASIMYDSRRLKLTQLTQTQLQAPLDELIRKGNVSHDFVPLARSTIRLLKTKEPDQFEVLVVSWHGVHQKLKVEEKKKQFQDLQVYLKDLSEREDAAILVGGDFNIKISLIEELVLQEFKLYDYTPSERREGRKIDYFMASPALTLTYVEYIDLIKLNDANDDPYRFFDHDPISTTVTRIRDLENVSDSSTLNSVPCTPEPRTLNPVPRTPYPCTPYPVPCTAYTVPRTQYPVTRTQYPVTRTSYPVPCTPYPIPRAPYPVTCTSYPVPCTQYLLSSTL